MIIHDRQIKTFFKNIMANALVLICLFGGEYAYYYHLKNGKAQVKLKKEDLGDSKPGNSILKAVKKVYYQ
ncbi:hypothetical protein A0256_17010 [Mucilaginibacter sp. PAMC 26640]|nr:hypothetical protein A0256_17010 [Mucilaginibacter sp. PAMC 26640]